MEHHEIPYCPAFTDADTFLEADFNQDHGSFRIRKQLVNPGLKDADNAVAPEGSEVYVHYEVFDDNGEVHDSSRQRDYPYHFTLGETHAAPLWTAAIRSMVPGEKAIFHCQAVHLYSPFKRPSTIKDNHESLNVHVEYLYWDDWSNVVFDGRIKKKKLGRGSKEIATPNDGSTVTVRYIGRVLNGSVFEQTDDAESFVLCKKDIIEGLELAIKSMCRGEKSIFRIDPSYAWGSAGEPVLKVPPGSTVEYEVELIDYSAGTLKWEMSVEEKVEFAQCKKDFGNRAFKSNQLERAERLYNNALELIQYEGENNVPGQAKQMKLDCWNNLTMLKMRQNEIGEAISYAGKVLAINPQNPKALYRRAQCYMKTAQPDLAIIDIETALKLDPESASLKTMHAQCKQAIIKANRKIAARFGGWCDQLSLTAKSDESVPGSTGQEPKSNRDV